jgi:hypothetical protein
MSLAEILFRPFSIKSLNLKNRIVMAPMTRGFAPEGIPGAPNAAYYRRRAAAGVGLILSEGTVIDRPASRNLPGIPFFHGQEALNGWKQVIEEVHAAGGRMGPQIWPQTGGRHDDLQNFTGKKRSTASAVSAGQRQSFYREEAPARSCGPARSGALPRPAVRLRPRGQAAIAAFPRSRGGCRLGRASTAHRRQIRRFAKTELKSRNTGCSEPSDIAGAQFGAKASLAHGHTCKNHWNLLTARSSRE